MTHPIPLDDLDTSDAELAALDALLAQGDDADASSFSAWFLSASPVDFRTWLSALPDDDDVKEAA